MLTGQAYGSAPVCVHLGCLLQLYLQSLWLGLCAWPDGAVLTQSRDIGKGASEIDTAFVFYTEDQPCTRQASDLPATSPSPRQGHTLIFVLWFKSEETNHSTECDQKAFLPLYLLPNTRLNEIPPGNSEIFFFPKGHRAVAFSPLWNL